jgi:uncharacterized protein
MPTISEARRWYAQGDPVHGFDHVLRVLHLAERIGRELGADMEIVRAAALLHDVSSAHPEDPEARGQHELDSAEFAREYLIGADWPEDRIVSVQHCIRAHRFRGDETPGSLEAKVLFDADKLDVMGAFGAARTISYAIQAGQPVYARPSRRFLEQGETEPGEPHSAYHEYLFKLRHIRDRLYTEPARRWADRRHKVLTAFFEQLAAEALESDQSQSTSTGVDP